MILIAIAWVLISISFWGWGRMFASFFGRSADKQDFSETGYFFMGLSFSGLLLSALWLFLPISQMVGFMLLGGGLGYAFACLPAYPEINFRNKWFSTASFLFLVAILMKAAAPTNYYDCGLYYAQSIQWIQSFPVVPGLANLHIRFGNVSSWHILGAAFDWPGIFKGKFDDLGELVLLWFVIFHGWNALKINGFERYVSLGLIAFSIIQAQPLLTAPSPDLASGLLGMQTLWQFRKFLRSWNPRLPNQLNTRGLALFVQSLFLAQIKLSALPFLIIAILVLFLILRERWYRMVFVLFSFGFFVAVCAVYRSYLLSGYLMFPVFKGFSQPDWMVLNSEVETYLDGVRGFARHILTPTDIRNGLTYAEIAKLKFRDWFPIWAADRKWNEWIIILMAASGWLLLVRFASSHVRRSFRGHWPLIFFTWLSGMMLLFWFSNAPDVRFGMAILGIGFSFTFASATEAVRNRVSQWDSQLYVEVGLIVVSVFSVFYFRDNRSFKNQLVFLAEYPTVKTETYLTKKGWQISTPLQEKDSGTFQDQCWNSPIPCSPGWVEGLEFRTGNLKDGFRRK